MVFLFLFFLSQTPFVYPAEDSCSYVNLSDPGQPMENVPVLDQGSDPLCGSYSTAVVLQTLLGNEVTVDPVLLAADFQSVEHPSLGFMGAIDRVFSKDPFRNGVWPCALIRHTSRAGLCWHPALEDPDVKRYLKTKLALLEIIKSNFKEKTSLQMNPDYFSTCPYCDFYGDFSSPELTQIAQLTHQSTEVFDRVFHESEDAGRGHMFRESVYKFCDLPSARLPMPKMTCDTELTEGHPKDFLKLAHKHFNQNPKLPLVISYFAGKTFKTGNQSDGAHASVLIGRRLNPKNKRCEFLIRNSWGNFCVGLPEELQPECSGGSVWIDADHLAKNSIAVFDIKVDH